MTTRGPHKKRDGMVLIDNHWVEETEVEQYLIDRSTAAEKAIAAMRTFCASAEVMWAGSEDGEAVVGFDAQRAIRSVIHLDPKGVQQILALTSAELIGYLK